MIFVDPLKRCRPVDEAGGRWRWQHYCHLFSDTSIEELHEFAAARLKLKRAYFQDLPGFPSYHLTPQKRALALGNGAQALPTHEMAYKAGLLYGRQLAGKEFKPFSIDEAEAGK